MSLIDWVIAAIVVIPWNVYLIYKMRKENAINNNTSDKEK